MPQLTVTIRDINGAILGEYSGDFPEGGGTTIVAAASPRAIEDFKSVGQALGMGDTPYVRLDLIRAEAVVK